MCGLRIAIRRGWDRTRAKGCAQTLNRFHRITRTDSEVAAAKILRAVGNGGRPRVLIGPDAYFVEILQRVRPTGYGPILARQFEPIRRQEKLDDQEKTDSSRNTHAMEKISLPHLSIERVSECPLKLSNTMS